MLFLLMRLIKILQLRKYVEVSIKLLRKERLFIGELVTGMLNIFLRLLQFVIDLDYIDLSLSNVNTAC